MGRYPEFDLNAVQTHSIHERVSLVDGNDTFPGVQPGQTVTEFIDRLPGGFGRDLRRVADAIVEATDAGRPIVFACGAHVIKCGLRPVLIQLMRSGFISALALHGAGAIHDIELALFGVTSEHVESGLLTGTFGMARETATFVNCTLTRAALHRQGAGEALGEALVRQSPGSIHTSLLAAGFHLGIPVTIHVAVGTDIVHMHPSADGAAIGETSLRDFRILTASMRTLAYGGVLLNIGSAVILPEVLLKAMALLRNESSAFTRFLGVDIDFMRSHRATKQIVERVKEIGGEGISLTGHHEVLLPLLAHAVLANAGE